MLLGALDITLRRFASGAWTAGDYVPGAASTSTISAAVQPATGRDLQTLPEGERQRSAVVVYTLSALRTGSQHDNVSADQLDISGVTYEVRHVFEHRGGLLDHHKALAVRLDEEAS